MTAPALAHAPLSLRARLAASQRPERPLFGPLAATTDGPDNLVEAGPLYPGGCIDRIADVRPAAELVAELTPPA
jgi:hypothetical protein